MLRGCAAALSKGGWSPFRIQIQLENRGFSSTFWFDNPNDFGMENSHRGKRLALRDNGFIRKSLFDAESYFACCSRPRDLPVLGPAGFERASDFVYP